MAYTGLKVETNTEYTPECLKTILGRYAFQCRIDTEAFVHGKGRRKTREQRYYEKLKEYTEKYDTCEDCRGCPYASQCKKTDKNRTICINSELSSMHKEVRENLESIQGVLLRMNRSIQAEGTFGVMKYDRWYKRVVRKGLNRVKLELFLVSIVHNLYKFRNKKMRLPEAA